MKKIIERLVKYYVKEGKASSRFLLPPLVACGLTALFLFVSKFGGCLRAESPLLTGMIAGLVSQLSGVLLLGAHFTSVVAVRACYDPRANEKMRKPLLWGGLIGLIVTWLLIATAVVSLLGDILRTELR